MNTKSIDYFIGKIGIGKYQYIIYAILGIYFIVDGAEVMALSFLNVVLKNAWNLSDLQTGMIGTVIFAGFFIGSILSGPIADRFGRRILYIWAINACFITGILSALSPNFYFFLLTRSLFGVSVGILAPLTATMLIEITPMEYRGRWVIWISGFFTIGEIIAIFVAYLTLDSSTPGNWRLLVVWITFPVILSAFFSIRYLKESPRFTLFKNFDEGLDILNRMNIINHNYPLEIEVEDKVKLQNWVNRQKDSIDSDKSVLWILLSKENKKVTILVWIMWFTLSFVYNGIIYIVPKTLSISNSGENTFLQVFISVLGEIPSYFIAVLLVENIF